MRKPEVWRGSITGSKSQGSLVLRLKSELETLSPEVSAKEQWSYFLPHHILFHTEGIVAACLLQTIYKKSIFYFPLPVGTCGPLRRMAGNT